MVYMVPHFSHFCAFCLVTLLFRMVPNCSAEVLSNVLKTVTCLMEETHVLDELQSGMSYNAVGCEFSINESTYITN